MLLAYEKKHKIDTSIKLVKEFCYNMKEKNIKHLDVEVETSTSFFNF